MLDEANTGNTVFRAPKDDRTAYALVFYPFNPSPTGVLPTVSSIRVQSA